MSNERETQDTKEFKGEIGGVNNRLADSAVNPKFFQVVEGIMPWHDAHRRIPGKMPYGKFYGMTMDNTPCVTIHAFGKSVLYQTWDGLFMNDPFEPETLDWASRAGAINFATLQNVDRLVRNIKAAGLWDKFIGLYPFAGGTSQAHAQNLISSNHTFTWVNGPTHNSLGISGNGISQYGYVAPAVAIPYLGHLSCYVHTPATTFGDYRDYIGQGNEAGLGRYHLIQCVNNDFNAYWAEPFKSAVVSSINPWKRLLIVTRPDSNNINSYNDGALAGTAFNADGPVMPTTLYLGILCRIEDLNTPAEISDVTLSLASFGHTLSAPEAAAFDTIVQTYQAQMGRTAP